MLKRKHVLIMGLFASAVACGDEEVTSESAGREGEDTEEESKRDAAIKKPDGGGEDEPEDAGRSTDASNGARNDAGVSDGGGGGRDASTDADAAGEMCSVPGESCASASCCEGSTCVIDPADGADICAAECVAASECNSGCCVSVRGSDVGACAPARLCTPITMPVASNCGGLILVAEDATFLGVATSSPVAVDGVCNASGLYGSGTSVNSIYNELGLYGSEFGVRSAYNTFSTIPPAIKCASTPEIVAFVTKNQLVTGAPVVDPDALCQVLANAGL